MVYEKLKTMCIDAGNFGRNYKPVHRRLARVAHRNPSWHSPSRLQGFPVLREGAFVIVCCFCLPSYFDKKIPKGGPIAKHVPCTKSSQPVTRADSHMLPDLRSLHLAGLVQ